MGSALPAVKRLCDQIVVEIDPMRVGALDQVEFPLAFPFLDLLLPAD